MSERASLTDTCRLVGTNNRQLQKWVSLGLIEAVPGASPATGRDCLLFEVEEVRRVKAEQATVRAAAPKPENAKRSYSERQVDNRGVTDIQGKVKRQTTVPCDNPACKKTLSEYVVAQEDGFCSSVCARVVHDVTWKMEVSPGVLRRVDGVYDDFAEAA